jgi:protein-glutamine gamma-glutamyltransferase
MPISIQPPVLIFLLSAIAIITLPHVWNIAPAIMAFFFVLLSWRFVGVWKQAWLPNKFILFLLTCAGIGIIYQQHLGVFGRNAGTVIFITALGLKLLEIKTTRDVYFIVFLAFIVAATLFLYQQSIAMAVYIIAACLSLLATLVIINMHTPDVRKALKTAAIILLQALPLGITFFILFPRLEAPHWTFLQDKTQVKTGLSETLEPGAISDLALSDDLVFRVKFTGAIPPQAQRYWRGPVFSLTDGKKWLPLPTRDLQQQPQTSLTFSGASYSYTLLMEPQDKNWVFALDMPAVFTSSLQINTHYQLTTTVNPGIRAEYAIQSYADYNTGQLSAIERRENLQLPPSISPEITALVRQLRGFDNNPHAFIQQLLTYFRTQSFYYSLTPPLMEEKPIDTFLFKTRTGFCSHYATAFVYLMRVAHIPARVVSGYQGGELNKMGNFLEIKQADAHAWTEVWLENSGWTRIDPTSAVAPERVEQGVNVDRQIASGLVSFDLGQRNSTAANLAKQLRQAWQNADYSWQRWVINYNNANQTSFLAAFGLTQLHSMLIWLLIIVSVLTLGLFWWLMRQPKKALDQASLLYQKFTAKLTKVQLHKHASETASAFASRITQRYPELAQPVNNITELFLKIRYGKNSDDLELKRLKQQIKAFKVKPQTLRNQMCGILRNKSSTRTTAQKKLSV